MKHCRMHAAGPRQKTEKKHVIVILWRFNSAHLISIKFVAATIGGVYTTSYSRLFWIIIYFCVRSTSRYIHRKHLVSVHNLLLQLCIWLWHWISGKSVERGANAFHIDAALDERRFFRFASKQANKLAFSRVQMIRLFELSSAVRLVRNRALLIEIHDLIGPMNRSGTCRRRRKGSRDCWAGEGSLVPQHPVRRVLAFAAATECPHKPAIGFRSSVEINQ